jgi:hypothetical protein
MKRIIILLLCVLPLLGVAQEDACGGPMPPPTRIIQEPQFKIGVSLGRIIDNENPFADYDLNFIGGYGDTYLSLGVISDDELNGFGRRISIGHMIHPTISLAGSIASVDTYTDTSISYGIDIGWQCWSGLHLSLGVETNRGPRLGIMWWNWKNN